MGNYSFRENLQDYIKIKFSNSIFKDHIGLFYIEYGKLELDNCNNNNYNNYNNNNSNNNYSNNNNNNNSFFKYFGI